MVVMDTFDKITIDSSTCFVDERQTTRLLQLKPLIRIHSDAKPDSFVSPCLPPYYLLKIGSFLFLMPIEIRDSLAVPNLKLP